MLSINKFLKSVILGKFTRGELDLESSVYNINQSVLDPGSRPASVFAESFAGQVAGLGRDDES